MNKKPQVLFNDALVNALNVVRKDAKSLGKEVTLVRDLRGRIRVIFPSKPKNDKPLSDFESRLATELGIYGFAPGRGVLFADELGCGNALIAERRLLSDENDLMVFLLDRQIIGQDWMRETMSRKTACPRVTFYSIKGGVGRSTALVNWAWHLAEQGKRVLIFDLDLESPGVSSSLLPSEHLPDFGVVDWFVEDGVGQAEVVEGEMLGISPLARGQDGEIKVVPAYGNKTGEYLPKLTRCYSEFSGADSISWAERLQTMVEHFEELEKPDVVIFDSRAGLHDIAAVLATRMDADTLLFAIDTPQTWRGYSLLFGHWQNHPRIKSFRDRLQVVASMVPETGREIYMQSIKEHAWDLFREYFYDAVEPQQAVDAFSFDLDDEAAPHWPVPIFWHRALLEFNPDVGGIDGKIATEALGIFFDQADRLLATSGKSD